MFRMAIWNQRRSWGNLSKGVRETLIGQCRHSDNGPTRDAHFPFSAFSFCTHVTLPQRDSFRSIHQRACCGKYFRWAWWRLSHRCYSSPFQLPERILRYMDVKVVQRVTHATTLVWRHIHLYLSSTSQFCMHVRLFFRIVLQFDKYDRSKLQMSCLIRWLTQKWGCLIAETFYTLSGTTGRNFVFVVAW